MGLEIKIKQPESKVDIYKVEELWKNACTNAFGGKTSPRIGVTDEFYRMELEFINTSKEYEENKIAVVSHRGSDKILFIKLV